MKRLFMAVAALMATLMAVMAQDSVPAFINLKANRIEMNGADWSALRNKLQARLNPGDTSVVRVLHIGDSHIQAEMVTNELRRLLQQRYGNAGRGLLMPLRLAGTNQSHDFAVTSPSKDFRQTRLLKLPWPVRPGLTGIAATPNNATTVTWKPLRPGHTIAHATLLSSAGVRDVSPAAPADSLVTPVAADEAVYGLITDNGQPGLLYSAIGNNGACFNDYLLIPRFAEQTAVFRPDLIVLSMGTNEAFSMMTDDDIRTSIDNLVRLLHHYNPDAAMLILTPMECQKNRNHGHKPLSPYYDINPAVKHVTALIRERAAALSVPVWDFYTVAGGDGASDRWIDANLFSRDRIHLINPGYTLQARLLNDALTPAVE